MINLCMLGCVLFKYAWRRWLQLIYFDNIMKNKVIVVGAGTAGSVIAKRFSDYYHVTVFDKSENKSMPLLNSIPLLVGLLYKKRNKFISSLQLNFNNLRTVPFFVSNVLGGCSVMNGCVHVVGIDSKWDELLKRFGLNKKNLKESYEALYSKSDENNKINIKQARESKLDKIFFESLEINNIPRGDVEWMNKVESGTVHNTFNKFFRASVMNLSPFRRTDLKMNCQVQHLIVNDHNRIIGVVAHGQNYLADVIILCAGVIGTNILLQSKALRISDNSYVDLKINSGTGVKDHTNIRVNVLAKYRINSLNEISFSWLKKTYLFILHFLGFKTLMMGTGATSAANLDIDGDGVIDARIHLLNFSEDGRIGSSGNLFSTKDPGFSISITCINPKSMGEVKIKDGQMRLTPNYLSKNEDMEHLKKTLFYVVDLLSSAPFQSLVKEIAQIEKIKEHPEDYINSNGFSGYHLIGGCSNLVNENFKLKDFDGLYICDASIMDEYVSSNIHSTVVLLADLFASKHIKS